MLSKLEKFFQRSLGTWTSHRSYFYANKKEVINSITNFEWSQNKEQYCVSWDNKEQNSQGSISFVLEGDSCIQRDKGYFTNNNTSSKVLYVSESKLKTLTIYNGMSFVETIEFISDDVRVRRTIATKEKTNKVFLIGNYIEYR